MSFEEKVLQNLGQIGQQIGTLTNRVDGLTDRMDGLETSLNARMDGLETSLNARMDGLESRLTSRMDGLTGRMDGLESTNDTLATTLAALQKTVDDRILPKLIEMDAYMHTELATKSELREVEDRLSMQIDALAQHSSMLEHEQAASAMRTERLERRVDLIERRGNAAP